MNSDEELKKLEINSSQLRTCLRSIDSESLKDLLNEVINRNQEIIDSKSKNNDSLNEKIEIFNDVPAGIYKFLQQAKIYTFKDLLKYSENDLVTMFDCSEIVLKEISKALLEKNLLYLRKK
jgi:hypothetical protein